MNVSTIENNLINMSFGLLLLSLVLYWWNLNPLTSNKFNYKYIFFTAPINLMLASSLILRWTENKYFPLSNLYESLIFLGWCLTSIQILIEFKTNSSIIGAITIPIVLLVIGFASISLPKELRTASPLVPALKSNWLVMHVTVMMLSYSTLMIGSLLSFLLLIISSKNNILIKGKSNSSTNKLLLRYQIYNKSQIPESSPINNKFNRIKFTEFIDNLSYRVIGFGFPLLTIGIISGAVWANDAWGTYWSWDPKETWALITWIVFAAYLHSRITKKSEGKKPAVIASLGFVIIWICYLGVNFLGKGLHTYGWLFT